MQINRDRELDSVTVAKYFERYGPLMDVRIFRNPDGTSRGCAGVEFVKEKSVQDALQEMRHFIDGMEVHLKTFYVSWIDAVVLPLLSLWSCRIAVKDLSSLAVIIFSSEVCLRSWMIRMSRQPLNSMSRYVIRDGKRTETPECQFETTKPFLEQLWMCKSTIVVSFEYQKLTFYISLTVFCKGKLSRTPTKYAPEFRSNVVATDPCFRLRC